MMSDDFLNRLNNELGRLEKELEDETEEKYLNIFVLGLPRSGTTLLSQVIFNNLDVKCTNNLMARFWKAPLVGAYLSKLVVGNEKSTTYQSTLGTTGSVSEPHEFSWFWHDLLAVDDITRNDPNEAAAKINWHRVRSILINLNAIFESAMVYKPLELVGCHLEQFNQLFKKALFIHIDREPLDVAYSLAQARLSRGDLNTWWSSYPPEEEYNFLKDKPYNIQIAGQVIAMRKMYDENLPCLPAEKLLMTSYAELCAHPAVVLERIQAMARRLGCNVDIMQQPEPLTMRESSLDGALFRDLKDGFKIMGEKI